MNIIKITEAEHVTLVADAPVGCAVLCAFESGDIGLLDATENAWALERLAGMRRPTPHEQGPNWFAALGQPIPASTVARRRWSSRRSHARSSKTTRHARSKYVRSFVGRSNETAVIMTLAHLCAPGGTRRALSA